MRSSPHGGDGRPALRLRRHLALVVDIEGITNVDENAHLLETDGWGRFYLAITRWVTSNIP